MDSITTPPSSVRIAKRQGKRPARFRMVAYGGGELRLPSTFDLPVVIDLQGAKFTKSVKANLNHDRTQIVGHCDECQNDGQQIVLAGAISGGGPAAKQVLTAYKSGYPWEASVEANQLTLEEIPAGKFVKVNGREFMGPILIARKSTIYGVAFVDVGADRDTTVNIAAKARTLKEARDQIAALQIKLKRCHAELFRLWALNRAEA